MQLFFFILQMPMGKPAWWYISQMQKEPSVVFTSCKEACQLFRITGMRFLSTFKNHGEQRISGCKPTNK
jgi:hypothetical protein